MRLVTAFVVAIVCSQSFAADYLDDIAVVKTIFDANGVTGVNIDSIARTDSTGRVIGLDLTNPEVARDYIRVVPGDIGKLSALQSLSLRGNWLRKVPEELGMCTQLVVLDLGDNELSSLPSSLENLTKLEKLDLRDNELRAFPAHFLSFTGLRYLHLRGNRLESLPEEIGSLVNLKELYLKGNRLSSLPKSIVNLNLTYLEIMENNLCSVSPEIDSYLKKSNEQYKDYQKCF